MSRFDPTVPVPPCSPGQRRDAEPEHLHGAGDRRAVRVGAGQQQAAGATFHARSSWSRRTRPPLVRSFRLTIDNQPVGGSASFLQFCAAAGAGRDGAAVLAGGAQRVRVVDGGHLAHHRVDRGDRGTRRRPVPGGLTGTVVLNPDPQAPRLQNPRLQNPRLQNPSILEAEAYNAGITNAVFAVPRLQNPRLQNPSIENPRLQNDPLGNPRLQNDAVANPGRGQHEPEQHQRRVPAVAESAAAESPAPERDARGRGVHGLELGPDQRRQHDGGLHDQPGVERADSGRLPDAAADSQDDDDAGGDRVRPGRAGHTVLVANIPDPEFVPFSDVANPRLQNPRLQNPTLALAPGESATITLRIVDPNRYDGETYDASGAVTPAAVAQSVNTEDVVAGPTDAAGRRAADDHDDGAPADGAGDAVYPLAADAGERRRGDVQPAQRRAAARHVAQPWRNDHRHADDARQLPLHGPVHRRERQRRRSGAVPPGRSDRPAGFDAVWNGADTDWSNPTTGARAACRTRRIASTSRRRFRRSPR